MGIYRLLFPRCYRSFAGKRWVSIGLRTLHLLGVAGLGGSILCGPSATAWTPSLALIVVSGLAMFALEIWASGVYLIQVRGQAMVAKLLLLAVVLLVPVTDVAVVVITILLSGVVSHAPASVRHYSLYHRRVLDSLLP